MNDLVLPLDAFVRAVGINRGTRHAFFLGAGTSVTSGVPSAQSCIWEWKRDIFLTNNPGVESQFTELSLAGVRQQIQQWLDRRGGYPSENSPEEYGFYIEECYPKSPENRRVFFQEKARKATPHIGYQLLCLLAEAGLVGSSWTTNFDGLIARSASAFTLVPVEVGIDCQHRATRIVRAGELLIVSLHGDYRYDALKNTNEELIAQESALRQSLIKECEGNSLIVAGYSGRDKSVMEALSAAYSQPGTGTLYWCVYDIDHVPAPVSELVTLARKNGRAAFIVASEGFDNLLVRLSLHCLSDDVRKRAEAIISVVPSTTEMGRAPFQVEQLATASIVKSNAFELDCPSEVLSFDVVAWPDEHIWKWVRDQTSGRNVVAVPFRTVLALGTVDDVKASFGANIKGDVHRVSLGENDFRYEDGAVVSLMREALVRSMESTIDGISSDGKGEIWFSNADEKRRVGQLDCLIFSSVLVFIRQFHGKQYIVLKPSIKVLTTSGEKVAKEIANPIKLKILGYQHNNKFNDATNRWRDILLPSSKGQTHVSYEFPVNCGSTLRFTIRRAPIFAEIGRRQNGKGVQLPAKFQPLVKQTGFELNEPQLLFAKRAGVGEVRDSHPIRGVVTNRPFDYALTQTGLSPSLRVGIICPKAESRILQAYLQESKRQHAPGSTESDYLPNFPGFETAFSIPLEIPDPGSPGWVFCGETDTAGDDNTKVIETAKNITKALDILLAASTPNVVVIFFPQRWSNYREFKTEHEKFDTHDFVKAYSVQRGIGTQFLEQSTLADQAKCRVWWWLSLAFYVKSMRTPWVLEGLDQDTAFVGLGYSVNHAADKGKNVVLGCSHLYNSKGQGLQYRLSKIENSVIVGGNPFMSREDARRVGEQIRELFFSSQYKLPRRVVIHKRTPFRTEERLGLKEGLFGVECLELIEIFVDESLRYVASGVSRNGDIEIQGYPVKRGTVIKLDSYSALLWVHGATNSVNNNRTYFQGKRRIPAPLVIRRHSGNSDLRMVAEEILGLSKMDWNSFDLYTKLPATVQSSNEIARIGSLLKRLGSNSYDVRLFI